jgi:hypothetical protein
LAALCPEILIVKKKQVVHCKSGGALGDLFCLLSIQLETSVGTLFHQKEETIQLDALLVFFLKEYHL